MKRMWRIAVLWTMYGIPGGSALPKVVPEPVDINRASVAEMMRVQGMTASWAERILRFRPYRTKLDLVEQGVVSQEVYQRIREGVVAHRVEGLKVTGKKRDYSVMDTR